MSTPDAMNTYRWYATQKAAALANGDTDAWRRLDAAQRAASHAAADDARRAALGQH